METDTFSTPVVTDILDMSSRLEQLHKKYPDEGLMEDASKLVVLAMLVEINQQRLKCHDEMFVHIADTLEPVNQRFIPEG